MKNNSGWRHAQTAASKRFVLSLVAIVMAFAMMVPVTAFAAQQATPSNPDYTVTVYNTGGTTSPDEDGQHVLIDIDYGAPVVLDPNFSDYLANAVITIAGTDITDPSYNRPATVSANGDILAIDIAGCKDASGNPAFTADYNGIVSISGTLSHVTVGGAAPVALDYATVAPVGFGVVEVSEGSASSKAEIDFATKAQVRGMFHIGLYAQGTGDTLVPIYTGTDQSPIDMRTYVAHAHSFTTMGPEDFAKAVVSAVQSDTHFDQTTYSIAVNTAGDGVVLSYAPGASGPLLYIYIVDDSLIHRVGSTYTALKVSGGTLPYAPK